MWQAAAVGAGSAGLVLVVAWLATRGEHVAVPIAAPAPPAVATAPASEAATAPATAMQPVADDRLTTLTLDPAPPKEADGPDRDGWKTEVAGSNAGKKLGKVVKLLGKGNAPDAAALTGLAATDVQTTRLRPEALSPVLEGPAFRILRGGPKGGDEADLPQHRGLAGLATALADLHAPFAGGRAPKFKLKVERVDLGDNLLTVQVRYHAMGASPRGPLEQTAGWTVRFREDTKAGGAEDIKGIELAAIEVRDYEEVHGRLDGPLFRDLTASVVGSTKGFQERILRDADHWLDRIETVQGADPIGHQGLSIADVNGDGLDDVYLCQPSGVPNALFLQQPDGTARDGAPAAGLDLMEMSRMALFVDLDGDGDQDVVIATLSGIGVGRRLVMILRNDGKGRFDLAAKVLDGMDVHSMAAADFDNDGDLDVYATQFNPGMRANAGLGMPSPYHDSNNGGANALLRNEGEFRFSNVTKDVGLDQNNRRWSYAASWEDYDNDGDDDLYVANDHGRNNLYRNDGGRFSDVAAAAGVEDISAGMSVSWGDYDRDGKMDLYVGNMYSAAGGRIAFQRRFLASADEETRLEFRRHARGNSLFRNMGNGRFADVSLASGTTLGRWAWSSMFADINGDGWQDLAVANGMFTRADTDDL